MRVLALEAYYGGSHQAFLDGWVAHSRHTWTLQTLSPHHWKWRMRHAALEFARRLRECPDAGPTRPTWDVVLATDMLNLAEFAGLAPASIAALPRVLYFHENQFTYPVTKPHERDLHFAFSNLMSAAAADAVWFNSDFHRQDFFAASEQFLTRMPDHAPRAELAACRQRSAVQHPGIDRPPVSDEMLPSGQASPADKNAPLRIVWAARWEHDKNPEDFFSALEHLRSHLPFELSVLGQSYGDSPRCFATAQHAFREQIRHWGFLESRAAYWRALTSADVFVSTAKHEFFGIAAVEAMAAGLFPLLPNRLAYPELLGRFGESVAPRVAGPDRECFLYNGSPEQLAERLRACGERKASGRLAEQARSLRPRAAAFFWDARAAAMDDALEEVVNRRRAGDSAR